MVTAIASIASALFVAVAAIVGHILLYRGKIEEIHHEVRHNSGRSMKDRSDQTVTMLLDANVKMDLLSEQMKGGFATVAARQDGLEARTATLEERMTTRERAD